MKQKIRIAVAIDRNGHWASGGWYSGNEIKDETTLNFIIDSMAENILKIYWIETEIDIPEIETIAVEAKIVE